MQATVTKPTAKYTAQAFAAGPDAKAITSPIDSNNIRELQRAAKAAVADYPGNLEIIFLDNLGDRHDMVMARLAGCWEITLY